MKIGETIVIDGLAYRLEELLSSGVGSYGQVWGACGADTKPVALKFINTEMMAQAEPSLRGHWRAHLEREIAFLAGMDTEQSQHIVALINYGQVDGQPVLVLERLAANLGQWLAQQRRDNAPPPDLEQILDWARQILAALDVIHDAGFVYRDLKFSNILVDSSGKRLKLADFGSLKRENGDSTRSFIGTPATMAPEQALPIRFSAHGGEYLVDYRADYYALGLLLFVLLTRQPTTAAQRRLGQLLAQHGQEGAAQAGKQLGGLNADERELLQQSIAFWAQAAPTLSLTRLVERMLARDPAQRPQSSQEMRTVLDTFYCEEAAQTLAPTATDWDLPPILSPKRRMAGRSKTTAPRWGRIAAVLGGIGIAGTLAWALTTRTLEAPPVPAVVADAVSNSAKNSAPPPAAMPAAASTDPVPVAESVAVEEPVATTPATVADEDEEDMSAGIADEEQPPVVVPALAPAPKPVLVAPEPKPAPKPAVAAPEPKPAPKPVVAAPEPKPAPKPAVAAPEPKPAPKPMVAAPEPKPAPKPMVAAPEPKPAPKPMVAAPEPKPAPKPMVAAPEPKPAPKPAVAAPEPKPAPKPAVAAPKPMVAAPEPKLEPSKAANVVPTKPKPLAKKLTPPELEEKMPPLPTAKAEPATAPHTPPPVPQMVKVAPPRLEKPTPPKLMPVQRPVPVKPEVVLRPPATDLPPIRLESRRPTPPAAPQLPPIQMVSRTQAAAPLPSTPTNLAPPPSAAPVANDPVQNFQDNAARAATTVRRDVEALTKWLGRTGTTVSTEVQRGLQDANQSVTRWTSKSNTKVERRDRWSDR